MDFPPETTRPSEFSTTPSFSSKGRPGNPVPRQPIAHNTKSALNRDSSRVCRGAWPPFPGALTSVLVNRSSSTLPLPRNSSGDEKKRKRMDFSTSFPTRCANRFSVSSLSWLSQSVVETSLASSALSPGWWLTPTFLSWPSSSSPAMPNAEPAQPRRPIISISLIRLFRNLSRAWEAISVVSKSLIGAASIRATSSATWPAR